MRLGRVRPLRQGLEGAAHGHDEGGRAEARPPSPRSAPLGYRGVRVARRGCRGHVTTRDGAAVVRTRLLLPPRSMTDVRGCRAAAALEMYLPLIALRACPPLLFIWTPPGSSGSSSSSMVNSCRDVLAFDLLLQVEGHTSVWPCPTHPGLDRLTPRCRWRRRRYPPDFVGFLCTYRPDTAERATILAAACEDTLLRAPCACGVPNDVFSNFARSLLADRHRFPLLSYGAVARCTSIRSTAFSETLSSMAISACVLPAAVQIIAF